MKLLFTLIIIWLAVTLQLAISTHLYQEDAEAELDRRAFLVYSRTLSGCMIGAYYSNYKFNFTSIYTQCRNLAYREKAAYIGIK